MLAADLDWPGQVRALPSEVGQAEDSSSDRQPRGKAQVVHQHADVAERQK